MRAPQSQIIHKVAWLYHIQGMRQEDIGESLGISRATVVNYLKRAREIGAVTIRVPARLFRDDVTARHIENELGLQMVWVIPDGSDGPAVDFSQAAGMVLLELVKPNSQMGLG
ncbi:MAG: sigma factor-like helix-turn-helix DNA-binding protein, partial [Albidovulum sp.]|uniref:sigma factor-like helix-turn-helix DNA-binding protein n=1 Tax=Albidovulum sp. TaxID=1872424 RepID=UPI003C81E605